MKLYAIIANNATLGNASKWVGSQADAAAARKAYLAEGYKRAELATHEVDVPTNKEGLLSFLNLMAVGTDVAVITERLAG